MEKVRQQKRVIFLSSAETPETRQINDDFVSKLNSITQSVEFSWTNYHDLGIEITTDSIRVYLLSTGEELSAYNLVYFKSYFRYQEQAAAVAEYLRSKKRVYIGAELAEYIPAYKLTQLARLSRHGVSIPDTIYLSPEHVLGRYDEIVEKLGVPFIFKDFSGSTGDDNYLIKNRAQLEEVLTNSPSVQFIAQNFIANSGDLRVIVMSGSIEMVIERRRSDDSTHLNNTSKGANSTLLSPTSLDESVSTVALKAASAMKRDVAGVDVMLEDGTATPYVLEVNASPQLGSGAYIDEKAETVIRYCERILDDKR